MQKCLRMNIPFCLVNKNFKFNNLKSIVFKNFNNRNVVRKFSSLNTNNNTPSTSEFSERIIKNKENIGENIITNKSDSAGDPTNETFNMKISFHSKIQISKDGHVLRFIVPEETSSSKFKTCRYVYLEGIPTKTGEVMKRPYHPISLDTDKGFIDIFIKVYEKNPREKFGIFSNYLANLQEGQVITLYGTHGHMEYKGMGKFSILKEKSEIEKKVKKIGMIAGGSGIAPMFQLIQKITSSRKDNTAVSLIYCIKNIEEMSFGEDLIKFDRKGKISFYPVVENIDSADWMFGKGKVNEDMIFNYMPDPSGILYFIMF
jgi:cytochrome-b5 reductase